MLKIFIICALFFIKDALTEVCEAENNYPWSYHGTDNDPYYWNESYPDCGKKGQSPVEIQKRNIVDLDLPQLQYSGFDSPVTKATVTNVGWTLLITPEDDKKRSITWGENTFTLDEIHFHFGSKNDPGAEHVIDNIRYEMEVHYVTYKDEDPNTVAVLAALMKADDNDNSAFKPITENLTEVRTRGDSTELQSELNLADLLPQDPGSYYYYDGSNSIPPCESGYVWWILKDIGKVGKDQLDTFMTLFSVGESEVTDSCYMGPNYRPLQNLNNRQILSSK